MSDPVLQQIAASQSSPERPINENFRATEHQATYGQDPTTTAALTWGYLGGRWGGFPITAGTVTLTGSTTNYLVVASGTGALSTSTATTNWNDSANYGRVYKITTSAGAVTAFEDHRGGPLGIHGGAVGVGSVLLDTDGTFAANSDTVAPSQKAAKTYMDNKLAGLSWKQAVRLATTANGTLATAFANGQTIDGGTLATGNRILIKNQSAPAENGLYTVNASGAPTRATDADSGAELVNATVYVSEGTSQADTAWTCSTNAPITLGSTSLTFAQSSAGLGDASTNTSSSVDSELVLFSGTAGKTLKRATGTGTPYVTSGVYSINKVTLTQPATGSTLTILDGKTFGVNNSLTFAGTDGKTLTLSNSLTFAGTDSTTMTFPPASAKVGYLNLPQNSQSTAYTTVAADAGKHLLHPAADTTARTFTIDSNANVPYDLGTAITFINQHGGGIITIAITSDTMRLAGPGTTGSRALAADGMATAVKIATTEWIISGTGLT